MWDERKSTQNNSHHSQHWLNQSYLLATWVLTQLHWLPVDKHIQHKLLSTAFRSVKGNAPLYWSDLLQMYTPSRSLQSESVSPWCSQAKGCQAEVIRPGSLQVHHTLSTECPAWEHQGSWLHRQLHLPCKPENSPPPPPPPPPPSPVTPPMQTWKPPPPPPLCLNVWIVRVWHWCVNVCLLFLRYKHANWCVEVFKCVLQVSLIHSMIRLSRGPGFTHSCLTALPWVGPRISNKKHQIFLPAPKCRASTQVKLLVFQLLERLHAPLIDGSPSEKKNNYLHWLCFDTCASNTTSSHNECTAQVLWLWLETCALLARSRWNSCQWTLLPSLCSCNTHTTIK